MLLVLTYFIDNYIIITHIKVLLTIYMIVNFFYAARIGNMFSCHYPMNLDSLGHCICVHQRKISAATGLDPRRGNHATDEIYWRHNCSCYGLTVQIFYVKYYNSMIQRPKSIFYVYTKMIDWHLYIQKPDQKTKANW